MMTFCLPRWQYWRQMLDVRCSLRGTEVRRGRQRIRPYLVALEERAVPASGVIPLDGEIAEPDAKIQIVMDIDHPNPKFLGIPDPAASLAPISGNDEVAVDVKALRKTKMKAVELVEHADLAPDASIVGNSSDEDQRSGTGSDKNNGENSREDDGEVSLKDVKVLMRAFARSFLVPVRILPEAALEHANGVPFVDRFVPPAASNPLPATASPRATEATGRPQLVTSPPDTGGVTSPPPTVIGPPATGSPITSAPPIAAPAAPAPVIGGLASVREVSLTPAVSSGIVLANFQPSALDLPRSGGEAPSAGDAGFRFAAPNTGVPVNNPATPAQSVPLQTNRSGGGGVTDELPDPTLPPIELVPSSESDQSVPVAPIETGVSGTAVFVTTVAALGLLASAYYSQYRRSGRGPRLRVQ